MWEGVALEEWRHRWGVPLLQVFSSIPSTNDVVKVLAENGAAARTLAIAEHQSKGRGRRERRWNAPAGTALLMSMLFRPSTFSPADFAGTIPLRVGMAAARGIQAATGVDVRLKWPNDIVATDGRKLAGILCESSLTSTGLAYTIVGIGINVLQTEEQLHVDASNRAASLRMVAPMEFTRAELASAMIAELRPIASLPAAALSPDELAEYARRDSLAHHEVTADGEAVGTAQGVGSLGELRVRAGTTTRSIHAGTIRKI